MGPGKRFLSGLTYYTYALADSLAETGTSVSVVLLRQLLPSRFYPGSARVGADLSHLRLAPSIRRFDGVDWFWIPSLVPAIWFLRRQRPAIVLVQWWTAAALHSELALAIAGRLLGARVVVEFHEVLDPGEDNLRSVRWYSRLVGPLLFRRADRYIVHSEHDRDLVVGRYRLASSCVDVVPHLVHDHYHGGQRRREAPDDCCNLLYFGVIRPFKGVEDLVDAFDAIPPGDIDGYWLTIVGETWEGWTVPAERIEASRYRDRITFVNRYVSDEELDAYCGGADAVVLPYHRSSMSGPLHVAMSYGLPVVVTRVGGLVEAAADYPGAAFVDPADPVGLGEALGKVAARRGERFPAPDVLWQVHERFQTVFDRVGRR